MPDVPKHAWTHRPRSEGGTDPIPFAGFSPSWAHAGASAVAVADAGTTYDFLFHDLLAGPAGEASNYEAADLVPGTPFDTFEWLQINEPGHYLMSFGIYWAESGVFPTGGFIQPSFELGGSRAQIVANAGVTDHYGPTYSAVYNSTPATASEKLGLYDLLAIQWNPDDPQSDIDNQNPLKIGVSFALSGGAASYTMGASVYVQKVADPGYAVLHSP